MGKPIKIELGKEYVLNKSGNVVKALEFDTIRLGGKRRRAVIVEKRDGKKLTTVPEGLLPLSVLEE